VWQIALTLFFIIEYWYYLAAIALIIIFVVSFNKIRKKRRLKIHREYRDSGVFDDHV
jgi:ribose/xylose/arabinose/galactoside ABC-type transport system permease subunit